MWRKARWGWWKRCPVGFQIWGRLRMPQWKGETKGTENWTIFQKIMAITRQEPKPLFLRDHPPPFRRGSDHLNRQNSASDLLDSFIRQKKKKKILQNCNHKTFSFLWSKEKNSQLWDMNHPNGTQEQKMTTEEPLQLSALCHRVEVCLQTHYQLPLQTHLPLSCSAAPVNYVWHILE